MPNALTNVATASPAVSATTATASGITTAADHARRPAAPWIRACSSSHSATNAVPGGSADAPSAPTREQRRGDRHPRAQPAQRVQVPRAGGAQHRPGGQEQHGLERRVVDHVQQRRGQRQTPRASASPEAAKSPAAPDAEEHQAHVLRRGVGQQPLEVGWPPPPAGSRTAPRPRPGPAPTSHHHRGPPPSRSRPTRTRPYTPMFTIAALISAETWLGASGCARGSHTCSGTMPGLGREPGQGSDEHHVRAPPGTARRPRNSVEGLAARARGEQGEPGQDRGEAEVGHHRVPDPGRRHLGAAPVLGEHQHQRGQRHQLPGAAGTC